MNSVLFLTPLPAWNSLFFPRLIDPFPNPSWPCQPIPYLSKALKKWTLIPDFFKVSLTSGNPDISMSFTSCPRPLLNNSYTNNSYTLLISGIGVPAGARAAMFRAQERPNTTKSSRELAPRRLAPCTETHADSPADHRPGTIWSTPSFTWIAYTQNVKQ